MSGKTVEDIDLEKIRKSSEYLETLAREGVGIINPGKIAGPAGMLNTGGLSAKLSNLKVNLFAQEIPID